MARALKVCSTSGCPELTSEGRCPACRTKAEQARGSASARGYGYRWSTVIQPRYLRAHPICRLCQGIAQVADHWPTSRRDLLGQGVRDPDAWHRLRPLCQDCHRRHTAAEQPGGWNRRTQ